MRPADETRSEAEKLFQDYIDAVRAGAVDDVEAFLKRQSPELQRELRRMIADYERLRELLGDAAPSLEPGRTLGDFRLVRELGKGGMSVVWEAEQLSLRRRVALKVLAPRFGVTSGSLERFEREARAGGRLVHPGIVRTYGVGSSGSVYFIVQELVPGGQTLSDTLAEVREARDLPPGYYRTTAALFLEAAEALAYAHEQGVVHRDVKPSNILLTENGEPRVADFGLAKIQDELGLSQTSEIQGTPYYMSPEQAGGASATIDHRTDVFSLGTTFYEALTLRRPFEGDTSQQVSDRIRRVDPPEPRSIRTRIPRDLAVICMKALEKSSDRRYVTMSELAGDLHRHLTNTPIQARPPTRVDRLAKWAKRNPAKSVAAGIASVTFTVIAMLLAANVRTNRALSVKSIESEQRRVRAEQAAQRERERADDVMRLSALQRLDDLIAEADQLWPAIPENIERYENWLERAQVLVDEIPAHEAKLAELRAKAMPWTEEEQARHRAEHPEHGELESAQRELDYRKRLAAIVESEDPGPVPTAAEVGIDLSLLPVATQELRSLAWPMIAPDRRRYGDERKGLLLARRAVEQGEGLSTEERAELHRTLAWALLANGFFVDASEAMEQALQEAGSERDLLEADHAWLLEQLGAELDVVQGEMRARQITDLERRIEDLETEVSERPEWLFLDAQDKWWHTQLEKLVNGIRINLADEESGLFSQGTSTEHGWGVKKRLASSISLRDGFAEGGAFANAWEAALPAICEAYPRLSLTPQLGLVPIGADPSSGLWEFAHLMSGAPPERGEDGNLVLTEEMGIVLVLIPAGSFFMGAQANDPSDRNFDPGAQPDESPVHAVELSAYFLSKYEMTQAQWLRLTGVNPSYFQPPGGLAPSLLHPVEQISWTQCMTMMDRVGLSLPSEAQWECGARAGSDTPWWTGARRESLRGQVNLADQTAKRASASWSDIDDWPDLDDGSVVHSEVGRYPPNVFGLHEVAGNVWEWCLDGFEAGFYGQSPQKNPVSHPAGSAICVFRGGSFNSAASYARSADRPGDAPELRSSNLGLRPARGITP